MADLNLDLVAATAVHVHAAGNACLRERDINGESSLFVLHPEALVVREQISNLTAGGDLDQLGVV